MFLLPPFKTANCALSDKGDGTRIGAQNFYAQNSGKEPESSILVCSADYSGAPGVPNHSACCGISLGHEPPYSRQSWRFILTRMPRDYQAWVSMY